MRRIIKSFLLVAVLSLTFASCATSYILTEGFASMAQTAEEMGADDLAKFFGAAESVSRATEDITPENEYYIGRSVAAKLLHAYPVYENPELQEYINEIAQTLVLNSPSPEIYNGYHVVVLNNDEINAFATTGGHIFLTKGMVNCAKNEDALAAAIAHEIGHVQLKHGTNVIRSSRVTDATTKSISAYLATTEDFAEIAAIMDDSVNEGINKLVTTGYSKKQELDADTFAVNIMNNAGYDAKEMLSLLNKMAETQTEVVSGMAKTHPSPKVRIKNVKKVLRKMKLCKDTKKYRQDRFNSIQF